MARQFLLLNPHLIRNAWKNMKGKSSFNQFRQLNQQHQKILSLSFHPLRFCIAFIILHSIYRDRKALLSTWLVFAMSLGETHRRDLRVTNPTSLSMSLRGEIMAMANCNGEIWGEGYRGSRMVRMVRMVRICHTHPDGIPFKYFKWHACGTIVALWSLVDENSLLEWNHRAHGKRIRRASWPVDLQTPSHGLEKVSNNRSYQ